MSEGAMRSVKASRPETESPFGRAYVATGRLKANRGKHAEQFQSARRGLREGTRARGNVEQELKIHSMHIAKEDTYTPLCMKTHKAAEMCFDGICWRLKQIEA